MDAAGPGFDSSLRHQRDMKSAANTVHCYHCTKILGTIRRKNTCSQNWILGNCGTTQPGANSSYGFNAHGLCAVYYVYAFENYFASQNNPNPRGCLSSGMQLGPIGIRMGPMQDSEEYFYFYS